MRKSHSGARWMMGALVLLFAVLVTVGVPLYARYRAGADAEQSARTAKFGINVATAGSGTLFGTQALMPGAEGTGDMDITFSGTPEVDVVVGLMAGQGASSLCLPAGYYHVDNAAHTVRYLTECAEHTSGTEPQPGDDRYCLYLAESYYPLRYTVQEKINGAWSDMDELRGLTYPEFAAKGTVQVASGKAGQALEGSSQCRIRWQWPDNTETNPQLAVADALLITLVNSDAAAGTVGGQYLNWVDAGGAKTEPPEGYCGAEAPVFDFGVVQVD